MVPKSKQAQQTTSVDLRSLRDAPVDLALSSVTAAGSDNDTIATVVTQGSSDLSRTPTPTLNDRSTFPEVLMEILSDKRNSSAITWLPNGDSFMILNRDKLSSYVLPRYFEVSSKGKPIKYTSFTRKLSRWGFIRDSDQKSYHHEYFRREGAALHRMVQTRGKKSDSDAPEKPRRDPRKSLPIKKRPVDSGAFEPNLTGPVSTVPMSSVKNDLRGSSLIGPFLSTNRHHTGVALEQAMNEAVLNLLRGSSLGYSSSVDPRAFSAGGPVLQQPGSSSLHIPLQSRLASQQQGIYFHGYNAKSA